MKPVGEVLLGKPRPEWGTGDVWMLRLFFTLAGVLISSLMLFVLWVLLPHVLPPAFLILLLLGAYGAVLFVLMARALPLPRPSEDDVLR